MVDLRDELTVLRKRIYRSLKSQATQLLGAPPETIARYQREYLREFKKSPRSLAGASKADLTEAIRGVDVTLIGDFHTYDQAQRTALRLMRDTVLPRETWALGLELISSRFQPELDRFQEGSLSEEEFLGAIQYKEDWGFPWKNYAPLIRWAIENRVKLIALNRPGELARDPDENDLEKRDDWAAGLITDYFSGAPAGARMIVLFGELHLGRGHLPGAIRELSRSYLKKPLRTLTIHQNQDDLYWKKTDAILRLRRDSFCVFSGTPWAKLQSLVNWTEHLHFEEADETSDLDPLSKLKNHGETLCRFLGAEVPSFDSLSLVTIGEADFTAPELQSFSRQELAAIRYSVLNGFRLYIPRAQIAYLPAVSENGLAELAAQHVRRGLNEEKEFLLRSEKGFALSALDHAFGFFGSLLLNPRRKCDFLRDHEARIALLEKDRRAQEFSLELRARRTTVEILNSWDEPELGTAIRRALGGGNPTLAWLAGRYVGQLLGRALHDGALARRTEPKDFQGKIREIFLSPGGMSDLESLELLRELLSQTGELPETKLDLI